MSRAVTASLNFAVLSQVNVFYKSIIQTMKKNREMRNTYKALNSLSDAELRDIGIHRSNIRAIAMERFYDNRGDL